ncbi:MAG: hypothetical protein KDK23_15855, partial [Leptospiraceae bacterium]|nr:hypothetical protein [Leptospiraceae bacterium]
MKSCSGRRFRRLSQIVWIALALLLANCATGPTTKDGETHPSTSPESEEPATSRESADPLTQEYLDAQKRKNQDVPVRIDSTGDSDGEAFVITTDAKQEENSEA